MYREADFLSAVAMSGVADLVGRLVARVNGNPRICPDKIFESLKLFVWCR